MFCKECGIKIPDDAQFCPFCGEVLEMEVKSQIDAHTLDNKLEDDFDLHLDWVSESAVLRQDMQTKIFLQVAKNTSAPVDGAKVQLSGPPQVNIVIKSRKIHPKKTINKIIFLISAEEPGLFTLTATLTSNAGHRIAYPFKIRVKPTKTLNRGETQYSGERWAKPSTYRPPTTSTNDSAIGAIIVFGSIGGIMFLAGIGTLFGGNFSIGITLIIIGFIICTIVLGIVTKGACCECCAGC